MQAIRELLLMERCIGLELLASVVELIQGAATFTILIPAA
jgi:hypothetical protein